MLSARLPWLLLAPLVVAAGLASRRSGMPGWVHTYAGDGLYAVLIYVIAGVLAPRAPPIRRGGVALAVCVAIELSQAWHPALLDAVRATRMGALVLGRGFLWNDLVAYAIGVAAAAALEVATTRAGQPGRV